MREGVGITSPQHFKSLIVVLTFEIHDRCNIIYLLLFPKEGKGLHQSFLIIRSQCGLCQVPQLHVLVKNQHKVSLQMY